MTLAIVGAGISVGAGIPDFRSSEGLFKSLKDDNPRELLTSGRDLFDASVFAVRHRFSIILDILLTSDPVVASKDLSILQNDCSAGNAILHSRSNGVSQASPSPRPTGAIAACLHPKHRCTGRKGWPFVWHTPLATETESHISSKEAGFTNPCSTHS